ncbi:hypothetical protein GGR53DRAFT_415974 [Hypoxylon sp. FL1150]|nr:hypothetical protein GGR53DRAFT_415974 [Hypoxylon sp. FL1150]
MRTRKQTRAEETTTADAASSPTPSSPAPPTVVSITKIEGPAVTAAPASKRDVEDAKTAVRSPSSKLPKLIQFPLVAILSLAISQLGYSLAWAHTKGALTAHARLLSTWTDFGLVVGWRLFELALGWFGNYDGYDITALNLMSSGPLLYLLFAFYEIPASALLITLGIETIATYIPFRLLRPLSVAHSDPRRAPNAEIVADRPIALLTTLLAGAIYSVTLFFAYATYLPSYLVVYFKSLPSVASAHEATYVGLLPVTLVLGFAARSFIFAPAADGAPGAERFDPVRASLPETVRWNFWGWSEQTKLVIRRTALLMLVSGVNTFLQTRLTVDGVETPGALAWSSVWVLGAAVTGLGLAVVGSV